MKKCASCKQELNLDAFPANKSKKDGFAATCKHCKRQHQASWYHKNAALHKKNIKANKERYRNENRLRILEYLALHPCVDCGESDPIVLEFDHLANKMANVAKLMDRNWPLVEAEIAKCEVRCCNCHRRKTSQQFGWYRWVQSINGDAPGS